MLALAAPSSAWSWNRCGELHPPRTVNRVIESTSLDAEWERLVTTLTQARARADVPFKTPVIADALHDPLRLLPRIAAGEIVPALLHHSPLPLCPQGQLCPAPGEHSTVEKVLSRLETIDHSLARHLADLPADLNAESLRGELPGFLERTSNGTDLADYPLGSTLMAAAQSTEQPALLEIAQALRGIAPRRRLVRLHRELAARAPFSAPAALEGRVTGPLLAARRTRIGWLVIGGRGVNHYRLPAALIIDLGGDDRYNLPAAPRTRLVIDLAGDDRYRAQHPGGVAGGILGASMVLDVEGDDRYRGSLVSQGAAVLGVGVLVDRQGHDVYRAATLAQGGALFGVGILEDDTGNDRYRAARYAQGFGGAGGRGLLRDTSGDDHYRAGGVYPSSYGIEGHFQAFSQGVGMGSRGTAAGGIGALDDFAGDDDYRSGNFSQGVGYYLGVGMLSDRGGDDRYRGGRYSQGAAAHLGVGVLLDRSGDDRYTGRTAANQGGAWDLAVGMLADCAGDDAYVAADLSLGAGAQNAIGLVLDAAGVDTFVTSRRALGFSGATDYDNGRNSAGNFGLFMNLGSGLDGYPVGGHAGDDATLSRGRYGLFLDR